MLTRLINRLFKMEEINGGERCPTYLYRWTLLSTRWFKVYLHHFVGDDWSRDLHDHPKRFISIGLLGRYVEQTMPLGHNFVESSKLDTCGFCDYVVMAGIGVAAPCCEQTKAGHYREQLFVAPWYRTFPAEHIHRLRLVDGKPCWTLVIVGKEVRRWGFWVGDRFIPWRRYIDSSMADKAKNC